MSAAPQSATISDSTAATANGPGAELDPAISARLKRDAGGLVPAVVQRHGTGEVLMVAWMNDEALHRTLTTREATYWSRSRGELWVKGATSGHRQSVRSVALDCDGDTLLIVVDQIGPACHTGDLSCFGDALLTDALLSTGGEPAGDPLVATKPGKAKKPKAKPTATAPAELSVMALAEAGPSDAGAHR